MFGFLALGFFSAMALKNNQNGGSGGGLLAGIVAALASIKLIKQYLKETPGPDGSTITIK